MAMKVTSTITLDGLLGCGAAIRAAAIAAMRHQGEAIKARSVALAPVDTGALEESHAVGTDTTTNGATITVSAGDSTTEAYDIAMHEGVYNLGPQSEAKAADTGQPVGRKFLERAFDEQVPAVVPAIANAIRGVTK